MAEYGPVRHQKNIIWTSAQIAYFIIFVHFGAKKLTFDEKSKISEHFQ